MTAELRLSRQRLKFGAGHRAAQLLRQMVQRQKAGVVVALFIFRAGFPSPTIKKSSKKSF